MPTFRDVVGQDQIKNHLKTAIKMKKVSHAYIISGERASGKEFIAGIFAQALLCEKGGDEPCGECHSCKQAASKSHPDIKYITHEKPASIGVDDIRQQISEDVAIKPYSSEYKIYIVSEAEKMTVQAQNAILKTLEEPPAYVVIMLLTTNSESFLQTIRSRCVELDMKPVQNKLLKQYLMEELEIPDYKADVCVAFAQGNVGKAREMAMSDDFTAVQNATLNLVKSVRDMDLSDAVAGIKAMSEYKVDPGDYLDIIAIWYRDVLLFKATGETDQLIFREELSTIRRVAQRSSYEGIEDVLEALRKARIRLSANVNFDLTMELLLLTIQEKG
ncbi:MAG: DNA polymerase III subunit delta' [Lachnospiraceae bacterium]|nr:DNA polymerase III subunit delta' [Lachnospiraceae bacterium]